MKYVATQRSGVKVFLLIAVLLALCFALSGCDYEDLFPTHEHDFQFVMYQYGAAVYTDGEITGIERVPCGQRRTKYEEYRCSICGKPLYKPAGGGGEQNCDTVGRYKVTTEPTCTKAGVQTATCSYCGKVYTKTVSALGHDYKNVDAKDPTCTEPGNTAGKKCKRCGHMHSGEELPALGHIWSEPTYSWSADLSACTASRVCARGHVETETAKAAVETTGNTCVGGVTTYSVTFTNPAFVAQSDTVAFNGVGHRDEIIPGVPATCKKTGLSEGKICLVCWEFLVEQEKTDKNPNNHEGPFVLGLNADVPSTCTTPGYHTEGICKACGVEVKTELPLDPDNHGKVVVLPAVPATCVSTGLTEGMKCAGCGKILVEQKETDKDPNNHEGPMAVVSNADVPSTCTTPGYHTERICKACGVEVKTELPLDPDNHGKVVVLPAVPATCVSTGLTEGTKCAACGKVLSGLTETPVDPDNHDWGEWMQTKAPNCTEAGTETRSCGREGCEAKETREVAALGHTGGTATCTAQAVCTRCNQPYGEALGHNWGAATYTWSADYSQCSAERECGRCHKGENATADALAEGTPATCEQAGKTTYTATFSDPFTTQTVSKETPALGHTGGTATCTAQAVCTRCEQPYGEAMGHDPVHHEAQAPTCTAPGWDTYDTCSRCDYTTTYAETPALGHDWGEWGNSTATCEAAGTETRACQRDGCGATDTRDVPALGHAIVHHDAQAPTCTAVGWDAYDTCSRCTYTTYVERPALGHDWGDWGNSTATCEAAGTETRACQRDGCGETDTRDADALGHIGGAATCQKKAVCDRCGQEYGDFAAHQWKEKEDGDKFWEGKEEVDGKRYSVWGHIEVCTVCKQEKKEEDGRQEIPEAVSGGEN